MKNKETGSKGSRETKLIVKPKLDVIFKMLFGDKKNDDILRGFLSAVLDIPKESIGNIEILNVEAMPNDADGKFIRLDVKLTVNEKIIDLEMQVCSDPDYVSRTLFYWAKMYTADLKSGEEYGELKDAVSINVLDFNMFECEEYHSHFQILETNRHEKLTDRLSMHFLELKKAVSKEEPESAQWQWMRFLNSETEEDLMVAEQTNIPEIKQAITIVRELSADEKVRAIAEKREEALHEKATLIGNAERRGEARGIEIGEARGIEIGEARGIEIGEARGIEIGENRGIKIMKYLMKNFSQNDSDEKIMSDIITTFGISKEEAEKYLFEFRQ